MDHAEPQTKIIKHIDKTSREKRLIVILENASLETVKVRDSFNLRPCCWKSKCVYMSNMVVREQDGFGRRVYKVHVLPDRNFKSILYIPLCVNMHTIKFQTNFCARISNCKIACPGWETV